MGEILSSSTLGFTPVVKREAKDWGLGGGVDFDPQLALGMAVENSPSLFHEPQFRLGRVGDGARPIAAKCLESGLVSSAISGEQIPLATRARN